MQILIRTDDLFQARLIDGSTRGIEKLKSMQKKLKKNKKNLNPGQ